MSPKKSPSDGFTSMQILSAKAQSLWAKAKTRMDVSRKNNFSKTALPPEQKSRTIVRVDIGSVTVAKATVAILLVCLLAAVLFTIRDKILILFLAMFLALVMDAHVRRLERFKIPRGFAVLFLYLIFLSVAVFLIASLIPIVATQIQDLARFINHSADSFLENPHVQISFLSDGLNERLTELTQQSLQSMGIKDRASALFQFGQNLSAVAQSSIGFTVQIAGSVVNFIINLILILFLAFFIQLEREKIGDFVRALLPREYRGYYDAKFEAIYQKVSQWFHGQLILCLSIGTIVFIALEILGMPYAQTLALLAAFTEFIPYAGPLIGALPAILIALTQSGIVWAIVVAIIYYVIQLCENNILVPLIMKHAVGLSPIAIMFGMLVGVSFPNTLHPILGIILAVPTTAVITIFVQDYYMLRRRK
jgi:predicted PurR-regulated permease PerM